MLHVMQCEEAIQSLQSWYKAAPHCTVHLHRWLEHQVFGDPSNVQTVCRTISSKSSFLSWSVSLTRKSGLSEATASLVMRAMRLKGSSGVWLDHNGIPAWAHAYPAHWNACDLLHALHIALRVLWKVFPSPHLPQLATSALKPYQLPGFGVDSWQVQETCISVGGEV